MTPKQLRMVALCRVRGTSSRVDPTSRLSGDPRFMWRCSLRPRPRAGDPKFRSSRSFKDTPTVGRFLGWLWRTVPHNHIFRFPALAAPTLPFALVFLGPLALKS